MLIKSIAKRFESIDNKELEKSTLRFLPFLVASIITGAVAVIYAQLFALAEMFSRDIFEDEPLAFAGISVICFLTAVFMVKKIAPYSGGSGIPQVMASIEQTSAKTDIPSKKLLGLRVIVVKIVSSLILVLGGGAIGREGPTIQIGGSIFKKIRDLIPTNWPKVSERNMITAGAAAGLAAAFNTPLGGIVFAIEELTKTNINSFKTAAFTAVIAAGLTAQTIAGSYLYLGFPAIDEAGFAIFFMSLLAAIISGIGGGILSKLILKILAFKSGIKSQSLFYLAVVGASLALFISAYFGGSVALGSGKEMMQNLLFSDNKYSEWYVPFLRMLGPLTSFTAGASGGIFAPGLSAGAAVGSFLSGLLELGASDTNILILCSMAAFLTGITRSPFTSAVLVLEMTDRHGLILFFIACSAAASIAAKFVDKEGLYEHLKMKYLGKE